MRAAFAALVLLAAAAAGAAPSAPAPAPAPSPEAVDIPRGEDILHARLFRPVGQGPFPAVVAMHGCGILTDHSGTMEPRYRAWGERLAAAGFAVLFPDSFGSRGLGSQCRVRERKVRGSRERVADAHAARRWLQGQPWVLPERVSLLGWSNGGIAVLWAVRPRGTVPEGGPDFRSAVAIYPNCQRPLATAWSARIPVLILIGSADDWTLASQCEQMVANARGRSARVSLHLYRGAYHGFDRPNHPVELHTGLAYTPDGSGRAHVGTNVAARNDAFKRVPEWLAR